MSGDHAFPGLSANFSFSYPPPLGAHGATDIPQQPHPSQEWRLPSLNSAVGPGGRWSPRPYPSHQMRAISPPTAYPPATPPNPTLEGSLPNPMTPPSPTPSSRDGSPAPPQAELHASSGAVLPRLFIDTVSKVFALPRTVDPMLDAFVMVGSAQPGRLSAPDLGTRLYLLASVLAVSERCKRGLLGAGQIGADELATLFTDLKIRLEDSFTLTKEQRDNIRALVQDTVYEPNRVTFKMIFRDVEQRLRKDSEKYRLTNIFGNPFREKVLMVYLRKTSSSVRNAFRQDIRDSIKGKKRCSLVKFTAQSALKYMLNGPGDRLPPGYMIHNALLRRFALENPQLHNIAEEEDAVDGEDIIVDPTGGPPEKRRITHTNGGRIPDGECFWSQVERYLDPFVQQWGPDMTAPSWKQFTDNIVRQDEMNFPHGLNLRRARSGRRTMVRGSTAPLMGGFDNSGRGEELEPHSFNPSSLSNILNAHSRYNTNE